MNVVFNCGDYFQDFCSYQAKVKVLRVCFFYFLSLPLVLSDASLYPWTGGTASTWVEA